MDFLETVRSWLQRYVSWQTGDLQIDYVGGQPDQAGLFPQGVQELERRTDILGNVTVRNRCSFLLRWNSTDPQQRQEKARWLLEFQDWIRQQSLEGLTPQLGTDCSWWAEDGRIRQIPQTGSVVYSVNLRVEYTQEFNYGGIV